MFKSVMEEAGGNLMKSLKAGDASSFSSLFNQYYSGLVVYANQFLRSMQSAEDIVHDVFANLWEKRRMLHEDFQIKGYLFTAVRNRCLNQIEHLSVQTEYQKQLLKKGDLDGSHLTWEYYVESELSDMIDRALNKLPPQRKKVFLMNRFDDKTASQIAEELCLSPRTVEKHIEKALQSLKVDLREYLPVALLLWFLAHWQGGSF